MRLNLGFEATLSHSFGELKLPLSQATLPRVAAVKAQASLAFARLTAAFTFQFSAFRFPFSALTALRALNLLSLGIVKVNFSSALA